MNSTALYALAEANPQLTAEILAYLADAAKADASGALMLTLLGLLQGKLALSTFAKNHVGIIGPLVGMLGAHPEILEALFSAMGH